MLIFWKIRSVLAITVAFPYILGLYSSTPALLSTAIRIFLDEPRKIKAPGTINFAAAIFWLANYKFHFASDYFFP
ncbi:MAG: hypothetical protein EOP04_00265 [Proteobacteria bacterium]|nr:MAG: hypothetical protein EOP04_00265 [Pseudomonadota bacterium]